MLSFSCPLNNRESLMNYFPRDIPSSSPPSLLDPNQEASQKLLPLQLSLVKMYRIIKTIYFFFYNPQWLNSNILILIAIKQLSNKNWIDYSIIHHHCFYKNQDGQLRNSNGQFAASAKPSKKYGAGKLSSQDNFTMPSPAF